MALAQNALAPKPFADNRPARVYTLLREQTYQLDFLSLTEKQEAAYEDRLKPVGEQTLVDKVEFKFVIVLAGADVAQTALEAMPLGAARDKAAEAFKVKYLDKGHGRFFWITCNKSMSAGGANSKRSNAYTVVVGLLNEGADLTPDQTKNLVNLLNDLEAQTPKAQFFGNIIADKAKGKNKLTRIAGRVPEDEVLPSWRQMARVADPREENDDPTVVCEVTGEALHGYEINVGERKGQWVSNTEAAAASVERYGKVLCPSEIRKAKQAAAAGGAQALPF